MYSQGEIDEAVAAGALAPEQAASLREFVSRRNVTPHNDEEYVRVYRGYNDLFITYACLFALVAVGWLGALVPIGGGGRTMGTGMIPQLPLLAPLLVTAASWGLAELFTRQRKTGLPSLLLATTFSFGAFVTLIMIIAPLATSPQAIGLFMSVAAAIAALASWGYYQRFSVTIAPALAVGFGVGAIAIMLGSMFATSPSGLQVLNVVILLVGIGVAVYAVTLDMKDPWRISDANEIGFWMHGVAATAIILPAASLLGLMDGIGTVLGGIAMIILFVVLTLVGLIFNRKLYAAATIQPLLTGINALTGGGASRNYNSYNTYPPASPYATYPRPSPAPDLFNGTLLTVIIISVLMLLLAIFWTPLRRSTMAILPASLRARLGDGAGSPVDQARTFQ